MGSIPGKTWRVKHLGWSSVLTKYCVSTDRVPFKYKESWLGLYSIELCSSVEPYTSKQHDKILHIFIILQQQTSICAKNNNLNVIYPTLGKFLPHNSKIANAISNVILLYCHLQALFPTTDNVIWCRFWLHCVKETHKCEKPSLRLNNRKTNTMFLLWCYRGQSNWSLLQEGGGEHGGEGRLMCGRAQNKWCRRWIWWDDSSYATAEATPVINLRLGTRPDVVLT